MRKQFSNFIKHRVTTSTQYTHWENHIQRTITIERIYAHIIRIENIIFKKAQYAHWIQTQYKHWENMINTYYQFRQAHKHIQKSESIIKTI